jgi:AraC-like DNA-binding protein
MTAMPTDRDGRSLRDFEKHIAHRYLIRIVGLSRDEPQVAVRDAFARAGLDYGELRADAERAPAYDLYRLLHELNRDDCCPGFSLRFGIARDLLDLGVLGYTMLSCPDLGMAMQVLSRFHGLTSRASDVAVRTDGSWTTVRQWVKPDYVSRRLVIDEDHLTGTMLVIRSLLGRAATEEDLRIELAHERPVYGGLYKELLGLEPEFGQPATVISFPTAWLKRPLKTADDTVEKVCESQCNALVMQLGPASELVDSVRRLILAVPPNRSPCLNDVADSMLMSTRTLERRLHEAGTSFRRVDKDVRMQLAGEYLAAGYLSNKEIAYVLGYSQPGTFYRAFKNWYGQTPGEYKRKFD